MIAAQNKFSIAVQNNVQVVNLKPLNRFITNSTSIIEIYLFESQNYPTKMAIFVLNLYQNSGFLGLVPKAGLLLFVQKDSR